MKIPKRNPGDDDDNDYDVTEGWYDPVQDKFIEPKFVDWVPLDVLYNNERHYVAGHTALAGYEWGSVAGSISGAFFWLATKHLPYFNTDALTVDTPARHGTAASASANAYATKSKKQVPLPSPTAGRLPVSHIQSFRKPWHFLVQRMATGSLVGGALGAALGLVSLYQRPHTCPLRRVAYGEQTLSMPNQEEREALDYVTFFPTTFYHAELLKHNFHTRMLESGFTLGIMGGIFSLAAEEGPVWLGLARGPYGVAQTLSLGGSFGFGLGCLVTWYINDLMRRWNEQQLKANRRESENDSDGDCDENTSRRSDSK